MNTGKVLLGVLAGVAAGAMIGILYAPEKGSKTRRKILDKGEDYAEGMKEKFDVMAEAVNKKYHSTMQEVDNIVAKGKSKYDSAMVEVEGILAKGKHKYDDSKNEVN